MRADWCLVLVGTGAVGGGRFLAAGKDRGVICVFGAMGHRCQTSDVLAESSAAANGDGLGPTTSAADLTPTASWSRRVRWVGGLIQAAFAAFWLVRGSVVIGGAVADVLIAVFGVIVIGVFFYALAATRDTCPRPRSPEGRRIERAVTIATVIGFAAAIVLPVIVSAAGHSDWVLPSIAITIGPLLLWLDHRVQIPRYWPIGWVLTVGPLILVRCRARHLSRRQASAPAYCCLAPPPPDSTTSREFAARRSPRTPTRLSPLPVREPSYE